LKKDEGVKVIFAANFKMNHDRRSTRSYLERIEKLIDGFDGIRVMVFPPATALQPSIGRVTVGAQNGYPALKGAYTGEIGPLQMEEFGIDTIMIGHSERRNLMGESQSVVAEKFSFYRERGFEIVYCIGEDLSTREAGEDEVRKALFSQLEGIDTDYDRLIVAYEPIWAIGTGRSASVEEIETTHAVLRERLRSPLLYGGSVNGDNIASITAVENVDGVLVGSASLDPDGFHSLMGRAEG
jgi:triosephosphate isomerase